MHLISKSSCSIAKEEGYNISVITIPWESSIDWQVATIRVSHRMHGSVLIADDADCHNWLHITEEEEEKQKNMKESIRFKETWACHRNYPTIPNLKTSAWTGHDVFWV